MSISDSSPPARTRTRYSPGIRVAISAVALALLGVHMIYPDLLPRDIIGTGLIIVAAFPWLVTVVAEAEFPGGWKVTFREVAEEQKRQAREIDWIKFLMRNFLTQYELAHLKKFASTQPFWFDFGSGTKAHFEKELRRLLDLRLIERLPGTGVRALLYERAGLQKRGDKDSKDVNSIFGSPNRVSIITACKMSWASPKAPIEPSMH